MAVSQLPQFAAPCKTYGPHGPIRIGPRVEAELRRRVRELECRCSHALTQHDRRELAALKDLLENSRKDTA
jgi:hypothetical protein